MRSDEICTWRIRVSWDSRNGICTFFCPFVEASLSAKIHFPRQERDLFISLASSNCCPANYHWFQFHNVPLAPVFATLSLPAKSTRLSLPVFMEPSSNFCSIMIIKTLARLIFYLPYHYLWERELLAFISVEATVLDLSPNVMSSRMSSSHPINWNSKLGVLWLPLL